MESPKTITRDRLISALLVDDERGAINTLKNMLSEYCPQIQVVGSAVSVREALEMVEKLQPDLVFLDIEMPPVGSGFDFLEKCVSVSFGVIFTTAYPQYAIQAINTVQPWSYLIKPYSVFQLKNAVETSLEKLRQKQDFVLQAARQQRIILQDSRKGTIILYAEEIMYCRADGSFTDLVIWKNKRIEKFTSSRRLGEFEAELTAPLFCRTHHSYLVNLSYVDRFERTGRNGQLHLTYTDKKVPVSIAKMDNFLICLHAT